MLLSGDGIWGHVPCGDSTLALLPSCLVGLLAHEELSVHGEVVEGRGGGGEKVCSLSFVKAGIRIPVGRERHATKEVKGRAKGELSLLMTPEVSCEQMVYL